MYNQLQNVLVHASKGSDEPPRCHNSPRRHSVVALQLIQVQRFTSSLVQSSEGLIMRQANALPSPARDCHCHAISHSVSDMFLDAKIGFIQCCVRSSQYCYVVEILHTLRAASISEHEVTGPKIRCKCAKHAREFKFENNGLGLINFSQGAGNHMQRTRNWKHGDSPSLASHTQTPQRQTSVV